MDRSDLDHIYAHLCLSMLKFLEWESLFEIFRLKVPLVGLMILGTSEFFHLAMKPHSERKLRRFRTFFHRDRHHASNRRWQLQASAITNYVLTWHGRWMTSAKSMQSQCKVNANNQMHSLQQLNAIKCISQKLFFLKKIYSKKTNESNDINWCQANVKVTFVVVPNGYHWRSCRETLQVRIKTSEHVSPSLPRPWCFLST